MERNVAQLKEQFGIGSGVCITEVIDNAKKLERAGAIIIVSKTSSFGLLKDEDAAKQFLGPTYTDTLNGFLGDDNDVLRICEIKKVGEKRYSLNLYELAKTPQSNDEFVSEMYCITFLYSRPLEKCVQVRNIVLEQLNKK